LSNNVYVKKELFSIKIFRWGREGSNIMYRVFTVSEDASAFITITLLFNFSRFFLNSKTTFFGAYENKDKYKAKNNLLTNLPEGLRGSLC
jgi:hypothetical protein